MRFYQKKKKCENNKYNNTCNITISNKFKNTNIIKKTIIISFIKNKLYHDILKLICEYSSIKFHFSKFKRNLNLKSSIKKNKFLKINIIFDDINFYCDRCKLIDNNINNYNFKDIHYQFCIECNKLISTCQYDMYNNKYTSIIFPENNLNEIQYYEEKNSSYIDKIEYFNFIGSFVDPLFYFF